MDTPESVSVNPYAPPVAVDGYEPSPDAPPYQLYSVTAITLAGFLGAALSACSLIALNYFRLRRSTAGWIFLVGGLLLTIVNFIAAYWLPEEFPSWPFWLGHTLLAYFLADVTQRRVVADHERQGGRLASIWWAVGISILLSIVHALIFVGAMLILDEVLPESYLPSE